MLVIEFLAVPDTSLCVVRKSAAQLTLWKTVQCFNSFPIVQFDQDSLTMINTKERLNHMLEVMTKLLNALRAEKPNRLLETK